MPEEINKGVDKKGCPLDTDGDGDGVPDYHDECLETPADVIHKVEATGCSLIEVPEKAIAEAQKIIEQVQAVDNLPPKAKVAIGIAKERLQAAQQAYENKSEDTAKLAEAALDAAQTAQQRVNAE